MNSKLKKIISIVLVCATVCSVLSAISFNAHAAVTNPTKTISAVPVVDEIKVDGVIEDAWDYVYVNKMEADAFQDSRGDAETRGSSSTVKFRIMYDSKKVYCLFEIYDDVWMDGVSTTNWQNDSLFFVISEDSKEGSNASWGEIAYMACLYPDPGEGKAASDLFFVRKGGGTNNGAKEVAVTQVDDNNRILEFSFELNTKTPVADDFIYMDFQYNDADRTPTGGSDQNRTIVWNWSTNNSSGNSAGNARSTWGKINFCSMKPNKQLPIVNAHSVTVDGVIDQEWESVAVNTLETDAFMDSKGNAETRKNSSKVEFRVMYSGNRIYMLFEIYDKDGDWKFGDGTNWKNDSIFICVSELKNPMVIDRDGTRLTKISDAQYSDKIYTLNAYPDTDSTKEVGDLFFVRSGKGTNNNTKEISVTEVDTENRIVELSFELNTIEPSNGDFFYLDIQYNDADNPDTKEEGSNITAGSPRTIVWNWSSEETTLGFSSANLGSQWGKLEFVSDTLLTHNDNKENGASFFYQESLSGDSYRIVGLIDEVAISNIDGIKITFSDGTTEKSITVTDAKAYKYIDATFDGITVTYVADEGTVIVGWVITGVPDGFVPSSVSVINS